MKKLLAVVLALSMLLVFASTAFAGEMLDNGRYSKLVVAIDTDPQVPACTAASCNYFVRSGLYFEVYDHRAVCGRMTELLADPGRRRLDIRFASAPVLEAAKRQLAYNGGMIEVLRGVGRQPQFSFSTEDKFHILTLFFPEGAQPEPAGQEDPQDEDPSIPGIDEPD